MSILFRTFFFSLFCTTSTSIPVLSIVLFQASFYDDPIKVYSYVHSQGIGTRVATLYIAWAQQFEKIGQLSQAEAVYQRAVENQAKPVDTVLQHYR